MITLPLILLIVALIFAILSFFSIPTPVPFLSIAVILVVIVLLLASVH